MRTYLRASRRAVRRAGFVGVGDAPIPLGDWFVQATNPGTTPVSVTAFALCVNAN